MSRLTLAAAVLVLLLVPVSIVMRTKVVTLMPGTAILFAAMGMPVNTIGLALTDITSVQTSEKGSALLIVGGSISNVTDRPVVVPPIALAIEGEHGEPLYNWSLDTGAGELQAGRNATFQARLASPPPAGKRVQVRFRDEHASKVALR